MTTASLVFGVDLGTTNSLLSVFEEGRSRVVPVGGDDLLPSVVRYGSEGSVEAVGWAARNARGLHPETTITSVKRRMGSDERIEPCQGVSLSPEQVSAEILRPMADVARSMSGVENPKVVVTIPAQFKDAARRATLEAAKLAGFDVVRLVNEPTAAAMAFFSTGAEGEVEREDETILVYDLGGGTFDVSVVEKRGSHLNVLASEGNRSLGGDDFDAALEELFLEQLIAAHGKPGLRGNARLTARLAILAEDAKKRLSEEGQTRVFDAAAQTSFGVEIDFTLRREDFEDLIRDHIQSTCELSQAALLAAGRTSNQISRIVLVGGSTRVPLVRRALSDAFPGVEIDTRVNPDLAVGLGASLNAALAVGLDVERVLVDVAPGTLGIAAAGPEVDFLQIQMSLEREGIKEEDFPRLMNERVSKHLVLAPILRKNCAVPARATEIFYSAHPLQERIEVKVGQGEARSFDDNETIGVFDFPLSRLDADAVDSQRPHAVEVALAYTSDGLVRIQARELPDGKPMDVVFSLGSDGSKKHALRSVESNHAPIESDNALLRKGASALARPDLDATTRASLQSLLESYRGLLAEVAAGGDSSKVDSTEDALLDVLEALP